MAGLISCDNCGVYETFGIDLSEVGRGIYWCEVCIEEEE